MTDDLVVKHLRLCQCGKPAGHNSLCWVEQIGTDQRVDLTDAQIERRRDKSDARKREFNAERRAARSIRDDWDLVQEARRVEELLSTVGVPNREPGKSATSQRVGPTTQRLEDDPRWRLAKGQLRRAAEQLLELGDEIRGHGIAATATVQLGEHKDAEILKCVGLKPREVVHHLGSEVAGGSRTVERVREAAGDCRWCGQGWPS